MIDPNAGLSENEDRDIPSQQRSPADAGAVSLPMGRVASPPNHESTTGRFYFWAPTGTLVEKTQLVVTRCEIGGKQMTFYGVVEEVYRRSRQRNIDGEVDLYDADLSYEPPFKSEGVTFADVAILRRAPSLLTPPLERSDVLFADEAAAEVAYGYNEMSSEEGDWSLPIGLIRNGGAGWLGPARVDLRDLCGDRAGHLNVTGQAGRATKSSFLLVIVRALIDWARAWDNGDPARASFPFSARPIVFNVKGNDLMFIDAPNRFLKDEGREVWAKTGLEARSFVDAEFYAPCMVGNGPVNREAARVRRQVEGGRQTQPYYWTLADVVRFGLWQFLFSDSALGSEPMMALADHLLDLIAEDCTSVCPNRRDHPSGLHLRRTNPIDDSPVPQSFKALREWLHTSLRNKGHVIRDGGVHAHSSCRALLSRLGLILDQEGRAIFSAEEAANGKPLIVTRDGTTDPLVIDIATLPDELRRFVVAAVLQQIKQKQTTKRTPGQVYFLVLDELGIYAPRGARDPITKLFEHVAAQLRSQGIILLGAQQQASKVSETIFGNSDVKALGASSPLELDSSTWSRLLSPGQKSRALVLGPEEKLVNAGGQWMNVVVPFPAWAMKEAEIDRAAWGAARPAALPGRPPGGSSPNGSSPNGSSPNGSSPIALNLPD